MHGLTNITSGRNKLSGTTTVTSGRLVDEAPEVAEVEEPVGQPIQPLPPLRERTGRGYPIRSLHQRECLDLIPLLVWLALRQELFVRRRDEYVALSSLKGGLFRKIRLTDWEKISEFITQPELTAARDLGRLRGLQLIRETLEEDIKALCPDFSPQQTGAAALEASADIDTRVQGQTSLSASGAVLGSGERQKEGQAALVARARITRSVAEIT